MDTCVPDMEIPETVPVMTLSDTVLFPHVVLPLYIFEPRYRQMLDEALQGNRLFAIAREDPASGINAEDEPPAEFATVGIIRASHQNADGTSNLVLQGLARVRVLSIESEVPYRRIRVEVVPSSGADASAEPIREKLRDRLRDDLDLGADLPEEFVEFIDGIEDAEVYLDYIGFAMCACPETKQRLLETPDIRERYNIFMRYLDRRANRRKLYAELQGATRDEEIERN
ncbi:MAG: LON peptidase substrate-binding domain-containing protein [Opitutales bacterium]|nr:LON peptidase substrate-binding domain-containing protein [Opitutales bacterium]